MIVFDISPFECQRLKVKGNFSGLADGKIKYPEMGKKIPTFLTGSY